MQRGIPLVPDDYPLTIRLGAIEMMSGNHDQAREITKKRLRSIRRLLWAT